MQAHYETLEKVEALLSLGDISSLDEQSTCPAGHSYSTLVDGYTVAYHRDRGEDWEEVKPKTCTSKDEILKIDLGQEYVYLFEDGQWLVNSFDTREFRPLSGALIPDTED